MNLFNRCKVALAGAGFLCMLSCIPVRAVQQFPIQADHMKDDDLNKGIQMLNTSLDYFFSKDYAVMHRFYNPFTQQKSDEKASVWMYTSAIESLNIILKSLHDKQVQEPDSLRRHYQDILASLYDNADYYLGTFELTSFTQTQHWSVYAVDRVRDKGKARVTGIYNVYDDQMWLIRELLESYHLTHNEKYLEKAEYLTAYVLDGWDATRDAKGMEHGGIPWGPGYVTKHACSNGPMISPLVWLSQIYKNKKDKITYRYIDAKDKKTRKSKTVAKRDYYLDFARKIYDWQKNYLLNEEGVYTDMMGECSPNCDIVYEEVNGTKYRAHTALLKPIGRAYTYNSGTMVSGAVDLYTSTKNRKYLQDAKTLVKASFEYFAKRDAQRANYYTLPHDGFNVWFNTVLLRGYVDLVPYDPNTRFYIDEFRKTLSYAYTNHRINGFLPADLLGGWDSSESKNNVEGMFMFSFASQWALFDQLNQHKK